MLAAAVAAIMNIGLLGGIMFYLQSCSGRSYVCSSEYSHSYLSVQFIHGRACHQEYIRCSSPISVCHQYSTIWRFSDVMLDNKKIMKPSLLFVSIYVVVRWSEALINRPNGRCSAYNDDCQNTNNSHQNATHCRIIFVCFKSLTQIMTFLLKG